MMFVGLNWGVVRLLFVATRGEDVAINPVYMWSTIHPYKERGFRRTREGGK
jgi:hypothetical protein